MNPLKSLLYSSLVLIVLLAVVSCACENSMGPDNVINPTNGGIINPTNGSILIERPLYIVSIPENSITRTVSIDTNILDLYISGVYAPDDFSVTHLDGVDAGIIDRDSLDINLSNKTISGTIALRQRLDFENPSDGGENSRNNDYEVALFRVMSETSSNDFKLIVRITDASDPKKLEILIDSYHLDDINQQRGIRELYLYEDSTVIAPLMGSDPNSFLTADLVEDTSFLGDVDASTDLSRLYDQNDRVDAFLTATTINNNSKTYHRLSIDFTEELYIPKVAIRGRQLGGYYGFVFILRDKNDHIISVHQASNPLSRGSGSDENATSTYDFVVDYYDNQYPITNFGIIVDNMHFNISENTTNVLLIDNFFVASGYEYERGFVSINPGADIDKFNTNDLYFLDNELVGLSFKTGPDAEDEQDADSNNVYELGTVTITNVDGGRLTFDLPVQVVNIPHTISLQSNTVNYAVDIVTSNIITDLTEVVAASNFENEINLGRGTYSYALTGADASYFKIVGNSLRTVNNFGFKSVYENNGRYAFQVIYSSEGGGSSATLNINIQIVEPQWKKIQWSGWRPNMWPARDHFQSVVLNNGDILVLGGKGSEQYTNNSRNDIWRSRNGGYTWENITWSAPWPVRTHFQAVVLTNNDILIMGGQNLTHGSYYNVTHNSELKNDIWRSSDGGLTWQQIPATDHWPARSGFQAVVLTNNDILVMGGFTASFSSKNDIWRSSDGGLTWQQIPATDHWPAKVEFQAIVNNNNDILVMGGAGEIHNSDVWLSQDSGLNWTKISTISSRWGFQAVVLTNSELLFMNGFASAPDGGQYFRYGIFRSSDMGTNWNWDPILRVKTSTKSIEGHYYYKNGHTPWGYRNGFQSVVVPNNNVLFMGGTRGSSSGFFGQNDVWALEYFNPFIK